MTALSITARGQDSFTNSMIGNSYLAETASDSTNRETRLITAAAEVVFPFTPVVTPSVLIVRNLGFDDPTTADPTIALDWGFATGVYIHELFSGESAVMRLNKVAALDSLYVRMAAGGSDTWFEMQVWDQ